MGQWAKGVQAGTPPFMCEGDFSGDGLTDEAIILIGQDSWRFVVFEQRRGGDFFPVYVALEIARSELTYLEAAKSLAASLGSP